MAAASLALKVRGFILSPPDRECIRRERSALWWSRLLRLEAVEPALPRHRWSLRH